MIVDSYSEIILKPVSGTSVGTLPDGMSWEDYLIHLDILIKETFPEMTSYKEKDFRCGKALLLLLKKYCFHAKSLGNAPKTPAFTKYLQETEKMLDEEITRLSSEMYDGTMVVLDKDKTFTIISNIMQLLTSVMAGQERQQAKEQKNAQPAVLGIKIPFIGGATVDPIDFAREDTSIGNVVSYLDNVWEITRRYLVAKANPKSSCEAFIDWNEFKYLRMILQITKMRLDEIGVF